MSTPLAQAAPAARALAGALHQHFTGNANFEGLPKKFKIGVDAGTSGARHLIQDLGLVLAAGPGKPARWDAWAAGGLGRQPTPGFPLATDVPPERVLPLAEAAVEVYRRHAPPGKRLKHVAETLGREQLAAEIHAEWQERAAVPVPDTADGDTRRPALAVPVFAGELPAPALRALADAAEQLGTGHLLLTPDQDVALPLAREALAQDAARQLLQAGLDLAPAGPDTLRVCPGNHQCKVGLAATRDLARDLIDRMGRKGRALEWAISGCPNSCSQPQLAQVGVVCAKLAKQDDGSRQPCYDLWRRDGVGFGTRTHEGVSRDELFATVVELG